MVAPAFEPSAPPATPLHEPTRIHVDGHIGWSHDERHPAGIFHTFDALDLSPATPPHKVHLFLPRGFAHSGRRYPVVWLLDGHNAFWPGGLAGRTWDVAGALERLGPRVREMIVVAIHPVNRDHEYTYNDWADGARDGGGLAGFTAWLADALYGFVVRNYPVLDDPRQHCVVGADHAGLAAFYVAATRAETFAKAACLSPSFWAGLNSRSVGGRSFGGSFADLVASPLFDLVHATLQEPAIRPHLWIDWGLKRDGGEHNRDLEARAAHRGREMVDLLVDAYGYWPQAFHEGDAPDAMSDLFTFADPIGGHDEAAWGYRFELMLQAFFAAAPADSANRNA